MKLTGAQILIQCLLEQKVDAVFGYPGGYVIDLYDELYKARDKITHYLTSHEQGAAHAADGYARSSGKTGVVIATSGPGATNLVTGIATAYMDSSPLVAITGNVTLGNLGRDSFQEVDITGVTMPVTKHNFIVKRVEELADTVREAFYIANSGRKGPVLVDIPKNIQQDSCEYVPAEPARYSPRTITAEQAKPAADLIAGSKRPILMAGGGVISSGASDELVKFAERVGAPVCCTLMGLGGFPASHPLSLGMVGMHGSFAANRAMSEADLIIAVGCRFSDRVAGNREKFGYSAKILHIDIDNAEINKNISAHVSLLGDTAKCLAAIGAEAEPRDHTAWLETVAGFKKVKKASPNIRAEQIIRALSRLAGPDATVATDVGQHQMWTAQFFDFEKPRSLVTSGGLGTMGFGMGAAIGASAALGKKKVFLVTGDGSFHMNMNEMATAVRYGFPVVVLVMNNNVLGMVRQWQKLFYGKRFSQTTLDRRTDYVKLAEAFGGVGLRIREEADIEPVLKQAIAEQRPVIVDCLIPENDNVLPMIPPGKTADDMITELTEEA